MEQMDYNLLFRWFVGLAMDAPIWDVAVFTKNRQRLLSRDVAAKLLSDDHFSVDGTLIEAWASVKRFRPEDDGGPGDDGGSVSGHGEQKTAKAGPNGHLAKPFPAACSASTALAMPDLEAGIANRGFDGCPVGGGAVVVDRDELEITPHIGLLDAVAGFQHPLETAGASIAGHAQDGQLHGAHHELSGWGLGRHWLSSKELLTTEIELSAIAAPAMTGLSSPKAASGIPRTL